VVASVEPFAIWLHQRRHPDDGARPLATLDELGRVRHTSLAARQQGVEAGMSLVGAEQRATGLAVVSSDGPDLRAAWESLLEEAFRYSPRVTPVREGVLAFTGRPVEARQFAGAFTARVGATGTLEEAQLLAYVSEPGEATVAEDPWRLLDQAPIYLLRGVGLSELNTERLRWLGVQRIGALRRWSKAQLTAYLADEGKALLPYLL
jgi:nucleotidyltransferase/DNA polymerase involved in DNA repair